MSVMDDAQILWDYHQMHHEPRDTDIAIGLGATTSASPNTPQTSTARAVFPLIVFTGANAPTTVEVFPRGEAVHYAERPNNSACQTSDRPRAEQARNTGENFTFDSRPCSTAKASAPRTATIISRPYQQRRAYATCQEALARTRRHLLIPAAVARDYIASIGDQDKVLNMLVGDTQRIWVYAARASRNLRQSTRPHSALTDGLFGWLHQTRACRLGARTVLNRHLNAVRAKAGSADSAVMRAGTLSAAGRRRRPVAAGSQRWCCLLEFLHRLTGASTDGDREGDAAVCDASPSWTPSVRTSSGP